MVNLHFAYTEAVNSTGASPVVSQDQIWRFLQRKARHAEEFVPLIDHCEVIEEKGNELVRKMHFIEGGGSPARWIEEKVKSYYPSRLEFHNPNGAVVMNVISYGSSMADDDLYLTYIFEWRHPTVEEGSERHQALIKPSITEGQKAVRISIESLRKLAAAGKLEA